MKKLVIRRKVVRRPKLTEAKLRKIIVEELVRKHLIEEGMWDDVAGGVKKLAAYVTKQFKSVAGKWATTISEKVAKLSAIPDDVKKLLGIVKNAMSQTGEAFKLDETLQIAKKLGEITPDKALQIVDSDFEGPVKERVASVTTKSEGTFIPSIYVTLTETSYINSRPDSELLRESFGLAAGLGVGLAIMGGLPMLFKGLHKLADVLGAKKTSDLMKHAEHVTHAFEQKTIDFVMPDKLAYAVYAGLWKMGVKVSKGEEIQPFMNFQIDEDKSGSMQKTKGLVYKVLLIYFAFNGIKGVLHAGASLLGFVEGTATTVKGVELAKGAHELSKLVNAGKAAASI